MRASVSSTSQNPHRFPRSTIKQVIPCRKITSSSSTAEDSVACRAGALLGGIVSGKCYVPLVAEMPTDRLDAGEAGVAEHCDVLGGRLSIHC